MWQLDRDQLLEQKMTQIPKTERQREINVDVAEYCDDCISSGVYGSYVVLASSKHTGLIKPNHKSLVSGLYYVLLEDLLAGRPLRTSVVVGASQMPGKGYFGPGSHFGYIKPGQDFKFWIGQLRLLGYTKLPGGEDL